MVDASGYGHARSLVGLGGTRCQSGDGWIRPYGDMADRSWCIGII